MCTYLDQVGSTYYFRRVVPVELRPFIRTATGKPRSEWKISLGTKDRAEAKRLIPDHAKATEALLDAARKAFAESQPQDPIQIARQRSEAAHRRRREDHEEAQRVARQEADTETARLDDERLERIDAQKAEADHLAYVVRTGNTARMEPEKAVAVRAVREAQEDAALYEERWRIAEARLRALNGAADSPGADSSSALPNMPKSPHAPQRTPQGNSAAVTITSLFKGHVASGALAPAIVKEWTTKINRFVEFLGHDNAAKVTTDDIHRWKNHVRDEVLPGGKRRSAQTVNAGYLSPIRSAFKHGVDERLIAHNPARDVSRVSQVKAPKLRDKDFTADEQRTILAAASKIDASGDGGRQALVRRWVPWICAYTGARVNEITQLRAEDVQQIDGHWIIKITPEAGRVKTNEVRYVPVHEHLLEQGFLTIVKTQKAGPIFYDPERGNPESERGQYKKAGERLAAWVRSLGIIDPGIKPNHAWRHTFKTIANEVGVSERAADYMQGHASKGVGRDYGRNTIKALADQMALIPRFPE